MTLGACLLAAGRGSRWGVPGENKLLADFGGRPMIACALDALAALGADRAVAVTGDARVAALCKARGLAVVRNDAPERGLSHSVALGVCALQDMDAALFLAADQPRVTGKSLRALRRAIEAGAPLACLCDETHWGNPAAFRAPLYGELRSLSGDAGAKAVLRAHEKELARVRCALPHELVDYDTAKAARSAACSQDC